MPRYLVAHPMCQRLDITPQPALLAGVACDHLSIGGRGIAGLELLQDLSDVAHGDIQDTVRAGGNLCPRRFVRSE
jgi:hypothetical protein